MLTNTIKYKDLKPKADTNGNGVEKKQKNAAPEYELDVRSDNMQDLLDKMPNWFVRWGVTFLLLLVLGAMILCWVIKYPDQITGEVTITSNQAPVKLMGRQPGKLRLLGLAPKDTVKEGGYIAYIENPANYQHILAVKAGLQAYQQKKAGATDSLIHSFFEKSLNLGDVQISYSQFLKALGEWRIFETVDRHNIQANYLQSQKKRYEALLKNGRQSKSATNEEVNLYQKHAKVDQQLYQEKAIAERAYEISRANFLSRYNSLQNIEDNLLRTELQLVDAENSLAMLQIDKEELGKRLRLQLSEAYNTLLAAIHQWEGLYVIKPPVSGKVEFLDFWEEGQFVEAGAPLFSVIPFSQIYTGRVKLPLVGAGKLKEGQGVKIKLFNYPHHEFGLLYGEVHSISLVTKESMSMMGPEQVYMVKVGLPEGLKTSFNNELAFQHDMAGVAEVITDDRRLIERLFENFKYLFKER